MRAITLLVRANDTHTCRCNDKGINGEGRVRCDPLSIGSFTVNLANYVSLSDALSLSLSVPISYSLSLQRTVIRFAALRRVMRTAH